MKCTKHGPIQYLTAPGFICVKNRYTIINFNGTDTLDSEAPELFLPKGCKEGFSKIIAVGDNFSGFFKILYLDKCDQVYQNGMVAIGQDTTSVELLYTKFGWEILTGASNTHSPAFSKELIEGASEWQNTMIPSDVPLPFTTELIYLSISKVYTNSNNISVRGIVLSYLFDASVGLGYVVQWIEINSVTNQYIRTLLNKFFERPITYNTVQLSKDGLLCYVADYSIIPTTINFYSPLNNSNPSETKLLWTYSATSNNSVLCALNSTGTTNNCIAILDQKLNIIYLYNNNGNLSNNFNVNIANYDASAMIYNTDIAIYGTNSSNTPNRIFVYDTTGFNNITTDVNNMLLYLFDISKNKLFTQDVVLNNNNSPPSNVVINEPSSNIKLTPSYISNTSFGLGSNITVDQGSTDIFTMNNNSDIIWYHSQTTGGTYTYTTIPSPKVQVFPRALNVSYDGMLLILGSLGGDGKLYIYFSQLTN